MDIQLKRGLLDVCVLAAIKSSDSYGYKIIKDMKPYIELSESTPVHYSETLGIGRYADRPHRRARRQAEEILSYYQSGA